MDALRDIKQITIIFGVKFGVKFELFKLHPLYFQHRHKSIIFTTVPNLVSMHWTVFELLTPNV